MRVDVSSRLQGQVRATYVEGNRRIPESLILEPLREEYYYEASYYPYFFGQCIAFIIYVLCPSPSFRSWGTLGEVVATCAVQYITFTTFNFLLNPFCLLQFIFQMLT